MVGKSPIIGASGVNINYYYIIVAINTVLQKLDAWPNVLYRARKRKGITDCSCKVVVQFIAVTTIKCNGLIPWNTPEISTGSHQIMCRKCNLCGKVVHLL